MAGSPEGKRSGVYLNRRESREIYESMTGSDLNSSESKAGNVLVRDSEEGKLSSR